MKNNFLKILLVCWTGISLGQHSADHIPLANQLEWYKAGLLEKTEPRIAERIINFKTDTTDVSGENDQKIAAIMDNISGDGLTIIYFPEGEFTFYEPIVVTKDNIVLQGAGAQKTVLYFENKKTEPCISVVGTWFNTSYDIKGPVIKGSKLLKPVRSITSLKNKWVQFYDPDNGYGQITKVTGIASTPNLAKTKIKTLIIKDQATRTYSSTDLRIAPFVPRQNVGIENLKIEKVTDGKGNAGSSIYLRRAVNCWVRGVESAYTSEHHIRLNYCSHIEISGNYLHHAQYYGEGGFGYGVNIQNNSTNILVENNIFKHLRHSIALQRGANCNVVTYNYSYDRRSFNDDIFSPENQSCDLVLHGNYPWGNLFEQNSVAAIAADNTHGNNGPYNAFVRNIARADGIIALQPGWYPLEYGLVLYRAAHTSLLGNIIKNDDIDYNASDLDANIFGRETEQGAYEDWLNIRHVGSDYRRAKDNPNSYFLNDASYFYAERPLFLPDNYTFPSIGPKLLAGFDLTQDIPARDRVQSDQVRTVNINPSAYPIDITLIIKTDESVDTTIFNQLYLQPIAVADTLVHPISADHYLFAGFEKNHNLVYDTLSNAIIPGLFTENIYTVIYKKINRSSYAQSYAENKRNLAQSSGGSVYNVYESMGHIFLEMINKSGNWEFVSDTNEKLFIDELGGSSPVISHAKDDAYYNDMVAIAYQQGSTISVKTWYKNSDTTLSGPSIPAIDSKISNEVALHPSLAWGGQGVFMVVWQDSSYNPGINYRLFKLSDTLTVLNSGVLESTNGSSSHAVLSVWYDKASGVNNFDVVWQQPAAASANTLHYLRLAYGNDGTFLFSDPEQLSKTSDKLNTNVSMVSMPEGAIACWRASDSLAISDSSESKLIVRNATIMGDFYIYDNRVKNTTLNKFDNNSAYYFGWSNYYSDAWHNYFVTSENLSWIRKDIKTKGNEFQFANTREKYDEVAVIAYHHDQKPYYFESASRAMFIEKPPVIIIRAKGFNFSKGSNEFDYIIQDIKVNDQPISFGTSAEAHILYSDPFNISEQTVINFEEILSPFATQAKTSFLSDNEYIHIRYELQAADGQILADINDVNIHKGLLANYNKTSFSFRYSKAMATNARIRISLLTNIPNGKLTKLHYHNRIENNVVSDIAEKTRTIKQFHLAQNYPNPFNPVTHIEYHVPHRTKVALRIYDILGQEVLTLVNEQKESGRYTVDIDAGDLAGGIYFYRMQAAGFTESRKMILIK